jgi:hypothetical protein
MSNHIPDATKMVCPHCNSPARDDWPCEFRCKSVNLSGRITRSPVCFNNEIAQLKAKVKRLEEAGDRMRLLCADGEDCDAWDKAKATQ